VFSLNGSAWTTDSDVDITLSNSGSTWTLTDTDDTVETYTTTGAGNEALLNSIKMRNGYTQTLAYNSSNQLVTVTDSYNRTLGFAYSTGLLQRLTTLDNTTITYGYNANNANNILASMAYPLDQGGSTYQYVYNPHLSAALTGVIDRYDEQNNTWSYDQYARGLRNQLGTGSNANITTVAYNDSTGQRMVTNALSVQDTYLYATLQNIPKVTQINRAASLNTAAATRTFSYDGNGFLASQTDWNGNQTTYANDIHGDPLTINEAVGSPVMRSTTITYDGHFVHLPATIATAGLTVSYTYDGSGNPLTKTLTDTTTTTSPYSTNGQTRTWIYTLVEFPSGVG
jgi:YD repeat-containing protein